MIHNFTKVVDSGRLAAEIRASAITKALDYVTTNGSALTVVFKAVLSESEITTLSTLVNNHVATPLPENLIQSVKFDGVADPLGKRARLVGIKKGTVPAGTEVNLDYKMVQLSYNGQNKASIFDGVEYYAQNASSEDTVTYQVVDVDNVLGYGAGLVIEEFAKEFFIMPNQANTLRLYKATIVPNLYLRVKYKSYGSADVFFTLNLFRHLLE